MVSVPLEADLANPDAPVGFRSGVVDLLYRDPQRDEWVVADYKTDAVAGDEELDGRASVYRPQVETYARILRDALDLDEEPHTELWFLVADKIIRL